MHFGDLLCTNDLHWVRSKVHLGQQPASDGGQNQMGRGKCGKARQP